MWMARWEARLRVIVAHTWALQNVESSSRDDHIDPFSGPATSGKACASLPRRPGLGRGYDRVLIRPSF